MTSHTIALTIHSLHGGGAERLMAQLANRWAEQGHQIHLITWDGSQDGYELDSRVSRVGLGLQKESSGILSGGLANWQRTKHLRKHFQGIRPTRIVSFCDQMNIIALQAARGLAIPVTIAEHSDPSKQRLSWLWEFLRQRNYPTADRIVALTPAIAEYMRPWCTGEMVVIPPAISPPATAAPVTAAPVVSQVTEGEMDGNCQQRTLLFVGRLSEEKGIGLLIETWRCLHAQLPDWHLRIVGDGPMRGFVQSAASELPRIAADGWSDQVWSAYRGSHLFILPSRYEGFPVALLEAMSQGLACVTSDCSSAIEQLSSGLRVCGNRNAVSFASAIVQLAECETLRRELAESAAALAQDYTWQRVGPMWDACLE
jgi:glycosyltransferase involved in cell wall biosynthesis